MPNYILCLLLLMKPIRHFVNEPTLIQTHPITCMILSQVFCTAVCCESAFVRLRNRYWAVMPICPIFVVLLAPGASGWHSHRQNGLHRCRLSVFVQKDGGVVFFFYCLPSV